MHPLGKLRDKVSELCDTHRLPRAFARACLGDAEL